MRIAVFCPPGTAGGDELEGAARILHRSTAFRLRNFLRQPQRRPKMRRILSACLVGLVSLFLLGPPAPADAQEDGGGEGSLEVFLLYTNAFLNGDVNEPVEDTPPGSLDNAFGSGLGLGWRLGDRAVVEAVGIFVPTEISVTGERFSVAFDIDLTVLGGGLRYKIGDVRKALQPYVAGGIGAKIYDESGLETESDFMWNFGGGLAIDTGWIVDVRVDLRDYMSVFDAIRDSEKLQNDILLNVAASFDLF